MDRGNSWQRGLALAGAAVLFSVLTACGPEQPESQEASATQKALRELQDRYDELLRDKLEDPVQWASEDIENLGDWEYRVESVSFDSNEDLAKTLNEFGNDRWEVVWLERERDGFVAVLKRPAVSYLSKIPLSKLGAIVIGGSGENQ